MQLENRRDCHLLVSLSPYLLVFEDYSVSTNVRPA